MSQVEEPVAAEEGVLSPAVDDKQSKRLVNTAFAVGVGSIFQPLQVSKVLIQLGYEPFPLEKGRAWGFFGREKRYLPNGFVYAKRLYHDFGISAIYRGASASICGNFLGAVTTMIAEERLAKYYGMGDTDQAVGGRNAEPNAEAKKFVRRVLRGTLSKTAGIVVARPFQVVMIRMIAQHIGHEQTYQGVFGSLHTIYKEEGLSGLFAGVIPQVACELCIFWTVSSASYVFELLWKSYVEKENKDDDELDEDRLDSTSPPRTLKSIIHFMVPYVVNSIFYPLQLVSTIMAVNGTSLVAGSLPFIPVYPTWQDCYYDLKSKDQLKRGAKMFFRFYEKPITYSFGRIYALPNSS